MKGKARSGQVFSLELVTLSMLSMGMIRVSLLDKGSKSFSLESLLNKLTTRESAETPS